MFELFIDNILIDKVDKLTRTINQFIKKEVVFKLERHYESYHSGYFTILQTDKDIKLYYRAISSTHSPNQIDFNAYNNDYQYTALATSNDGINFIRPNLAIIPYKYDKQYIHNNNLLLNNYFSHNFFPLYISPTHYLAIAGHRYAKNKDINNICMFSSKDGVCWKNEGEIININQVIKGFKGTYFDSLNCIVYNILDKKYLIYLRHNKNVGVRKVQVSESTNLKDWKLFKEITINYRQYNHDAVSIYSPNIFMYGNIYFGLANTMIKNDKATKEVIFMYSRDGYNWIHIYNIIHKNEACSSVCGMINTDTKSYIYLESYISRDITRYEIDKNRFICYEGIGILKTKPINITQLFVNFNAKSMQLDIYDNIHTHIYNAKLSGNHINYKIDHPSLDKNKLYYLIFSLDNAKLYSFSY